MPLYRQDLDLDRGWPLWAMAVRPDLWPPGHLVTGLGVTLAARSLDRAFSLAQLTMALKAGYGDPGAAEALVLGGLVRVDSGTLGVHWKEVT